MGAGSGEERRGYPRSGSWGRAPGTARGAATVIERPDYPVASVRPAPIQGLDRGRAFLRTEVRQTSFKNCGKRPNPISFRCLCRIEKLSDPTRMNVDCDCSHLNGPPTDDALPEADARLLAQIRAGDADAEHRFVREYYPSSAPPVVFRCCRHVRHRRCLFVTER